MYLDTLINLQNIELKDYKYLIYLQNIELKENNLITLQTHYYI